MPGKLISFSTKQNMAKHQAEKSRKHADRCEKRKRKANRMKKLIFKWFSTLNIGSKANPIKKYETKNQTWKS